MMCHRCYFKNPKFVLGLYAGKEKSQPGNYFLLDASRTRHPKLLHFKTMSHIYSGNLSSFLSAISEHDIMLI